MYILPPKDIDVSPFFQRFRAESGGYNTNGWTNLSVDASGKDPSVSESGGIRIREFIKDLFEVKGGGKLKLLDVGSGIGCFQKVLDEDSFFEAYSFEGAVTLVDKMVCNKNKVVICDLSKKIEDECLYKAFHLTTSFEFVEHVHETHQDMVWRNIVFLSDFHLCSIHAHFYADSVLEHCTIKSPGEWETFFDSKGIKYQRLGEYPVSKDKTKEIFRERTGLYNWNCSVIYLLDFRNISFVR